MKTHKRIEPIRPTLFFYSLTTTTYQDTSENKESQIVFGLIGTALVVSIITCLLYFFRTKSKTRDNIF